MDFKIFIQARRDPPGPEESGETERMFSYAVSAANSAEAVTKARQRFEFEHGLEGWSVEGIGSIELPSGGP